MSKRKGTVFVSDLHLGDVRWTPERHVLFDNFLDQFVTPYATQVVIAGDLVEWIQYGVEAFRHSLKSFLKLIELPSKGIPIHYIVGNHDIDFCMLDVREKPFSITYPRQHLMIEGMSFHVEHGHFYDPTISTWPAAAEFFARWGGKALDKVGPGFEDVLGRFKENLLSHLLSTTGQKENADEAELDTYVQGAAKLAAKDRHDYVVFGHTHKKTMVDLAAPGRNLSNAKYVNTGDWQVHSDFAYFCSGKMGLFSWDSDKEEALQFVEDVA